VAETLTTEGVRRDGTHHADSARALNRALLQRQLLLRRVDVPVADALEHIVGMQSTVPHAAHVGLWARVESFTPSSLVGMLRDREAVRMVLMRGTSQLVTGEDALCLRPVLQPALERDFTVGSTHARRLNGIDTEKLLEVGRAVVEDEPRTGSDIGQLLADRWPQYEPDALAAAVVALLPMVQVPPSEAVRYTTVEAWLERPLVATTLSDLIFRYLAAFGPATLNDMQTWSGLTRLGDVVEHLRPRLRVSYDEQGAQLFDLPGAPRPPEDVTAPVRFLPEYDNILSAHADPARIVADDDRGMFHARGGVARASVLIGGFVRASWRIVRERGVAVLDVEPYGTLRRGDRDRLDEEGLALLAFTAGDADRYEVRISSSR
jgi:hypothetical protein